MNHDEKMDSIQLEYTYLLTSQLESQRRFFEDKIDRIEANAQKEIDDMVVQYRSSIEETKALHTQVDVLTKEKAKSDQRLQAANTRVNKLIAELKEEKQMNENLVHNQNAWKKEFADMHKQMDEMRKEKDKEITELKVT